MATIVKQKFSKQHWDYAKNGNISYFTQNETWDKN